jgi:hypothetical protein
MTEGQNTRFVIPTLELAPIHRGGISKEFFVIPMVSVIANLKCQFIPVVGIIANH